MLLLSTCKDTAHTDRETFKKLLPVITYEDIHSGSDINRIANGDTSPILCSQPISDKLRDIGWGEKTDANN